MFFRRRKKKSVEKPVVLEDLSPEVKAALNILERDIQTVRAVTMKASRVRVAAEQLFAPEKQ